MLYYPVRSNYQDLENKEISDFISNKKSKTKKTAVTFLS